MIELFNRHSGEKLAVITELQLDFIVDHLEEDTEAEQVYRLTLDSLDFLKKQKAPAELVALLKDVLGKQKKIDIEYHIVDEIEFDYDEEEEEEE